MIMTKDEGCDDPSMTANSSLIAWKFKNDDAKALHC